MTKAWEQIARSTRRTMIWLWRLLTSVKLALALILVTAVVGLTGIVLDQVPGHLAGQAGGEGPVAGDCSQARVRYVD